LVANQNVSFIVVYPETSGILIPELYNVNGELIMYSFSSEENEVLNFTAPTTGVYYLRIYALLRCPSYKILFFQLPIEIDFNISVDSLTITLSELVSLNNGIIGYKWQFGDNNSYLGMNVNGSYTYTTAGNYSISLSLILVGNISYGSKTKTVSVYNSSINPTTTTTTNTQSSTSTTISTTTIGINTTTSTTSTTTTSSSSSSSTSTPTSTMTNKDNGNTKSIFPVILISGISVTIAVGIIIRFQRDRTSVLHAPIKKEKKSKDILF
jgi:PKD repeat protein